MYIGDVVLYLLLLLLKILMIHFFENLIGDEDVATVIYLGKLKNRFQFENKT